MLGAFPVRQRDGRSGRQRPGARPWERRIDCWLHILKVLSWYLDSAYLDKPRGIFGDTITPPSLAPALWGSCSVCEAGIVV